MAGIFPPLRPGRKGLPCTPQRADEECPAVSKKYEFWLPT